MTTSGAWALVSAPPVSASDASEAVAASDLASVSRVATCSDIVAQGTHTRVSQAQAIIAMEEQARLQEEQATMTSRPANLADQA